MCALAPRFAYTYPPISRKKAAFALLSTPLTSPLGVMLCRRSLPRVLLGCLPFSSRGKASLASRSPDHVGCGGPPRATPATRRRRGAGVDVTQARGAPCPPMQRCRVRSRAAGQPAPCRESQVSPGTCVWCFARLDSAPAPPAIGYDDDRWCPEPHKGCETCGAAPGELQHHHQAWDMCPTCLRSHAPASTCQDCPLKGFGGCGTSIDGVMTPECPRRSANSP